MLKPLLDERRALVLLEPIFATVFTAWGMRVLSFSGGIRGLGVPSDGNIS